MGMKAGDVMDTEHSVFTVPITPHYAAQVVCKEKHKVTYILLVLFVCLFSSHFLCVVLTFLSKQIFPVVDSEETKIVIGYVTRRDLRQFLDRMFYNFRSGRTERRAGEQKQESEGSL